MHIIPNTPGPKPGTSPFLSIHDVEISLIVQQLCYADRYCVSLLSKRFNKLFFHHETSGFFRMPGGIIHDLKHEIMRRLSDPANGFFTNWVDAAKFMTFLVTFDLCIYGSFMLYILNGETFPKRLDLDVACVNHSDLQGKKISYITIDQ